jgi:hypothetical protein
MKKKTILVLIPLLILLSSCIYGGVPPIFYPESGKLGTVWYETEGEYSGVWTRRGNSNVFDAVWKHHDSTYTAVLTIHIFGNSVRIKRRYSSDGADFNYTGTLSDDGTRVYGSQYRIGARAGTPWSATIRY